MDQANYYDDGVARVLDLMRATFGEEYTYFDDELINIPEQFLPCIMVTESVGEVTSRATGIDRIIESVTIVIVLNAKDDLNPNDNSNLTGYRLRKMVKGQDPTTPFPHEYYPKTIMSAIRRNITMDEAVLSSTVTTEFGPNVRGDELDTQEARVTVVVERQAAVPSRS